MLVHGSDLLLESKAYQAGIRPLLKGARVVFANSRNTARLAREKGVEEARIRVVCPGVVMQEAGGAGAPAAFWCAGPVFVRRPCSMQCA